MFFASDNWAGAAPEIVEAVAREAARYGEAYGESEVDRRVEARFSEIFERDVAVYTVATGSAANALAMASVARPGGFVVGHRDCHMVGGEAGGVELQTGMRLYGLDGADGRIAPETLKAALAELVPGSLFLGRAAAVSITQQTEAGTAYQADAIAALAIIAHGHGLPFHMDGARFANALVGIGATPAEMTWKAGVDILSFGATKNGCMAAEAVVFFDRDLAREVAFLRKRTGHLFSKSRFVAAQLDAYLADGLWLRLAGHANAMADRLRAGLAAAASAREAWPTAGNEVFAIIRRADAERLRAAGARFHDWPAPLGVTVAPDETVIRLVSAFATKPEDVDAFLAGVA